ncbi:MAG: ATP-binding protein, partial [Deltaproteobacteria bacterium]|nr:ATP-binding protein [Deltaproteobacteria bacterium]
MKKHFQMMNQNTLAPVGGGAKKTLSGKMEDVKGKLKKLKPFIGKRADALWVRFNSGDRDEKQELLQVINLISEKYGVDSIEDQIVLPPLDAEEAKGDISIGQIHYLNKPPYNLSLRFSELTRHTGIFGSTGTGKTSLAKNILRELVAKNIPFIVFDWEKNYRDLTEEFPQIKIFTIGSDISPFFFNYLNIPPGLSYKDYVKNVIEVFSRAYIGGVGSDSVLLKVFDQAYQEHNLPTTEDARKILSGDMTGKRLRGREMLWKQSSLRMLEFLSYGGTGKVYNVKEFYPIEKLQDDFVIFELGALANNNDKRFFVEIFTLWYWLYKEHQGIEDERLKHILVFEEFHNIIDNSHKDDLIQKIFRQIRKYGTGLVIIDQTPSMIPNPIFENLYAKITFSLNHIKNVSAVANAMNMERDEAKFIGMLKTGQAICRLMGRYHHPFLINVPFTKSRLNIPDNRIRERMRDFYKDYMLDNLQIDKPKPLRTPTDKFIPSPLARIFLQDLLDHPFDGADKRAKRLGLIPRDA